MGNKRYDKLKASFEASQPQLPDSFTNRVMKRVDARRRAVGIRRVAIAVLAAAAGIALVVLLVKPRQAEPAKPLVATTHVARNPRPTYIEPDDPRSSKPSTHVVRPVRTRRTENPLSTDTQFVAVGLTADPNIHYAAHIQTEDTVAYQAPSRMEEFIAKMADFNQVKAVPLNCSSGESIDSTVVSTAYVFEDKEEFDLFARLLQAACWYDSKTPGYLLHFSYKQFFFTLKDLRKGEKYLWIAERLMGERILLFSTRSPIETNVSSVCYQKYREQLTHTNFSTLNY